MDTPTVSSRGTDPGAVPVTIEVNGTLFELLRERLQPTGTMQACDPRECGHPEIDTIFVNAPYAEVSPPGVKSVGEIGLVGTAAADAIHYTAGKRVRSLPLTVDKLLG